MVVLYRIILSDTKSKGDILDFYTPGPNALGQCHLRIIEAKLLLSESNSSHLCVSRLILTGSHPRRLAVIGVNWRSSVSAGIH